MQIVSSLDERCALEVAYLLTALESRRDAIVFVRDWSAVAEITGTQLGPYPANAVRVTIAGHVRGGSASFHTFTGTVAGGCKATLTVYDGQPQFSTISLEKES